MRIRRVFVVLLGLASPVLAASNRVFVASTGTDTGACPITAPCRSFSYAMTQVAAKGEVIALDTAGYGTFTITQPVTVFAPNGVTAFIAVTAGTGIQVAAAPADDVVLRGLALSGNASASGINFPSGHTLSIENCIINGFGGDGIAMLRSADVSLPRLRIEHSTIRFTSSGVHTSNLGSVQSGDLTVVTISNSSVSENLIGLLAEDNTRAAVSDSVFSGNSTGIQSLSLHDSSPADVNVDHCTIAGNSYMGVQAGGGGAGPIRGIVRIARNLITGNFFGAYEFTGGTILSMDTGTGRTNTIEGNAFDTSFAGSYTAK
jgi:hypothetical protein